jgi:hypothetical protein
MSAKADCEELMNALMPVAEKMLRKHGEFYPYGGAMLTDGEIVHVAGYDGREHPPSADLISLIKWAFVEGAKDLRYKATALVYDVRITLDDGHKSDAINVSLDHRDDYSVVVLFPYVLKKRGLIGGRDVVLGEAIGQRGEADIFPTT